MPQPHASGAHDPVKVAAISSDARSATIQPRILSRAQDWLPREELARLDEAEIIRRLMALKPMIAARAREAERLRQPVDEVFQAIRSTGVFYYFVPKRFGGLEFDLRHYVDTMLPVAEACASTGWITSFCAVHIWMFAHLPEEGQAEIFGQCPYVIAPAVTMPPGTAEKVEGGYRLSGHWRWATGVTHADWALVSGLVMEDSKPTGMLWFALPIEELQIIDTWNVDGMAATGSHDIKIENGFVPAHRSIDLAAITSDMPPGAKLHGSPIYRLPMMAFLALAACIPAVGNAKGAVAYFRNYLNQRSVYGTTNKHAEKPAAQMRLALADLDVTAAELVLRNVAEALMKLSRQDGVASVEDRIHLRSQVAYAMHLSRTAVGRLMEAAGSSAHDLGNPLQRAWRDANMMATHVALDIDAAAESRGRTMVGLPPNSVMI